MRAGNTRMAAKVRELEAYAGANVPDDLASEDRLRLALAALSYNQAFVNFTDGKANSLLLVNSIFLATGAAGDLGSPLTLAAAALAAVAVLLSLAVVYARLPGAGVRDRAELMFFSHIRRRRNPAAYEEDFLAVTAGEINRSLARQVYDLAGVVEKKFRAFRWAQIATGFSAAVWIGSLIRPAVRLLTD